MDLTGSPKFLEAMATLKRQVDDYRVRDVVIDEVAGLQAEVRRLRDELKAAQGALVQIDGAVGVAGFGSALLLRGFEALWSIRIEKVDLDVIQRRATISGPLEAVPATPDGAVR